MSKWQKFDHIRAEANKKTASKNKIFKCKGENKLKKILNILRAVICVFSLCAVGFAASAAEADESTRSSASAPPGSDFSFSEQFSLLY